MNLINNNMAFNEGIEHRMIAEKYMDDTNPNGRIEESRNRVMPRGGLYPRVVPLNKDGSYYNPTNYDPTRFHYQN